VLAIRAERFAPADAARDASNLLPCRPTERFYRGKYIDQRAESDAGPLRLRVWDKATNFADFAAVRCSEADCVVVPQ